MTTLATTALNQIVIMLILIIVGVVCFRIKLIDKDTNKRLSDVVLQLVNPIVIFVSYQREYEATLMKGLLISLVLAVISHVIAILIAIIFLPKKAKHSDLELERFAVIYSNCGFMGIPLVNGLFGGEGVFYLAAYVTIFNLLVWTQGVILMTGKKDWKTIKKVLVSPTIIAIFIGLILFVTRISLPKVINDTLNYIGDMNTPLAMLVAGVMIAQTSIVKLLKKIRIYYVSFLKLIVFPLIALFVFSLFQIPSLIALTCVLAASCPSAVTISLFSIRFGKNYLYSTELFAMTTILSVITIPIVMTIAGYLL